MELDEGFETLIHHQHRELMAANAVESDLDFAFNLQLQEAMTASIALQPSSSSSSSTVQISQADVKIVDEGSSIAINLQAMEFDRFQQERRDAEQREAEMRRITADLRIRAHDERFAREILQIPEDKWADYGDEIELPISEKTDDQPFRLYFKGMASKEFVNGKWVQLAAVCAAVCDQQDNLLFQIQKPVPGDGVGHKILEFKALLEGLNAVASLGIKRLEAFTDYKTLCNLIEGRWLLRQRKAEMLLSQVTLAQRKFEAFHLNLLPRNSIKFVFKLARDMIDSQITKNVAFDTYKSAKKTCKICLEDVEMSHMFAVDVCLHQFCFSCMKQHVEVKLLHGKLPSCPHDGCNTQLNVESSRRFLPPKLIDIMIQRMQEASIPVNEKVYCPYPKCSALMSRSEARQPQQNSSGQSGLRICIKCNGYFCINCKVPWHERMSCYDYKRSNSLHRAEEEKLKNLARQKLWRQCVKCKHMIELGEGCFHMTCRCGFEFCYTCGAEWRDKKATCKCPLWDENLIWNDEDDSDGDDDDDYDVDEDEDENYNYNQMYGGRNHYALGARFY